MKLHKFKHTDNEIKGHNGILYEVLPKQTNGFKYRLLEDYYFKTGIKIKKAVVSGFISLKTTGRVHIGAGFLWDGATCFPDIQSVIRASMEHDALYTLIIKEDIDEKFRLNADLIFKSTCISDKMGRWVAVLVYAVLSVFGMSHIRGCIDKGVGKGPFFTSGIEVK